MATATENAIQQVYIGLLGRSADPDGLAYWAAEIDAGILTLEQLRANIVNEQPEYAAGQGLLTRAQTVEALYQNLFERAAEAEGLEYWVNGGGASVNIDQLVLALINGASAADTLVLDNKTEAAIYYTDNTAQADFTLELATAAVADVDNTMASVNASKQATDGVLEGETFELTTGIDRIEITSANTIDTVVGVVANNADGDSTFGVLDDIQGNGFTEVQLAVTDLSAGAYDAGPVTMSGVAQLDVVGAATGSVTLDASGYGTEISTLNLAGNKATTLNMAGLETAGALDISVAGAADLVLSSAAAGGSSANMADGLALSVWASGSADLSFGTGAITASLGNSADVSATYGNDVSAASSDVTVGDIVIGDITMSSGTGAELDFRLENMADVTGGAGSATVGSVTVGNLTLTAAESMDFSIDLDAEASTSGDATIGNTTIGNISTLVKAGPQTAELDELYVNRDAEATKGNATIGDLLVGDISMVQETSGNSNYLTFSASASGSGTTAAATIGSTTIGNVSISGTVDTTDNELYIYNWAYADNADATIGDISVGNFTVDMGKSSTGWASISATASATSAGNATIGNMMIGNVAMMAGVSASYGFSLENEVDTDAGVATIGDMTVGDVSMTAATSADLYFSASNEADAATSGYANIGDMTIGDITASVGSNADVTFYAYQFADANGGVSSSVGTQTVGNITVSAELGGYFYGSVENEAWGGTAVANSAGAQTVGDINMTGGAGADLGFGVSMTASSGTAGDQTVGDITYFLENSATATYWQYMYAGTVGNVTLGDQTVTLGTNANYDLWGVQVTATTSDIGNVSIGDVNFVGANGADFTGSNGIDLNNTVGSVGDITIGDIDVQLGNSGSFTGQYLTAASIAGSVGDTTIGNVSLNAAANSASATWAAFIEANSIGTLVLGDVALSAGVAGQASADITLSATADVGTVSIGDVALSAVGNSATAVMGVDVTAGGTYGDMSVGNISIDMDMTDVSATAINNFATLDIATGATTTTVGDITLSGSSVVLADTAITSHAATAFSTASSSSLAVQEAYVNIAGVDLVIGDVTVSGGGAAATTTAAAVINADNFGNFDWLDISGVTGDVTIGDIDYSGYDGTTDIDVSGFIGADEILAAQGGGTITLNTTKNAVTLSGAADTVVFDAATTLNASADVIDQLVNFASGTDSIAIDTASGLSDFAFDSFGDTYANFLTDAANAMTNFGTDIFAQTDGTDTWVGIDEDNDGTLDFSIALTGIVSVTASDFAIS